MEFAVNIWPKTKARLMGYGRMLSFRGYLESKQKPNLFYKADEREGVVYFADMRGTDMVPIWSDPSPLFYVKFTKSMPRWKKNRIAGDEFRSLHVCRLSNELHGDEEYDVNGDDGYCRVCGKDFQGEGPCCSKVCCDAFGSIYQPYCRVCGRELKSGEIIKHHISYEEDKTIIVCRSCHLKIHRSDEVQKLKPVDKRK